MPEERPTLASRLYRLWRDTITFDRLWKLGVLLALLWIASELAVLNDNLSDQDCDQDSGAATTKMTAWHPLRHHSVPAAPGVRVPRVRTVS